LIHRLSLRCSETPAFASWQDIYRGYGQDLTFDQWRDAVGRAPGQGFDALAQLAALVGTSFDATAVRAERQALKHALAMEQPLRPGVHVLLTEAQALGLPCAIASSSDRAWVSGWLQHHRLDAFFRCLCTAEMVAHAKPAPDLYLCAAACLGLPPAACLAFEDSPNGVRATQAAGMRCVAVPGPITAQLPFPPVDLNLATLDAVPLRDILAFFGGATAPADARRGGAYR